MVSSYEEEFSFHEQLRYFYVRNRGKIRSRYNDLTRKFLAYNDREENPTAFLRPPQFEALETYVFIKEFLDNAQVYKIFDDWRNKRGDFADASYYSARKGGLMLQWDTLADTQVEAQTETLFRQMKKYRESYPNYNL